MKRLSSSRSLTLVCLLGTLGLISGCSGSFATPDTVLDEQGGDFGPVQGTVFGGHAPLVGAHVYLLTTGSGAIGAQASSLLGSGTTSSPGGYTLQTNPAVGGDPHIPAGWEYVVTDSTGSFNLTNAYKCGFNKPVYIYAYGGAPTTNSPPGGFNPSVVNLATLGLCPGAESFKGTVTYVYLNEVSTVATAYAFQGFTLTPTVLNPGTNDATHIGYSGINSSAEGLAGIQNAANNTLQLYDIQGGVSGHNANYKTYNLSTSSPNYGPGTVPQATLDTVANILAACVDSSNIISPPAAGTPCGILFATATADGTTTGIQPTDTATAAINIARHPAGVGNTSYASTLNGIPTGAVPFSPNLGATAPPDFTIGIQFPTSAYSIFTGTQSPQSVATDSSGNVWFTTQGTAPNPPTTYGTGYLVQVTPLGTVAQNGLTQHYNYNSHYTEGNIAIDSNQNAWVGTMDGVIEPIYEYGPTLGYVFTSSGTIFTRPDAPVADNSTSSGNLYMVHGPTCPTPNYPYPNTCPGAQNNPTLSEVMPGPPITASVGFNLGPVSGGGTGDFIAGVYVTHAAIDAAGYIWMTSDTTFVSGGVSYNGSTTVRVNKATGALPLGSSFPINSSGSATCGNGILSPEQPAIDAAGNAWIPVYGTGGDGSSVMEVYPSGTCNPLSPSYSTGNGPYGAAVDGVSNVWITNRADSTLTGLNYTTGAALSSTNFQPQNAGTNLLNDPQNLAIDISGDVFITNFNGNSLVEIIGLTTPVYGPLGVAAGAGKIGATP